MPNKVSEKNNPSQGSLSMYEMDLTSKGISWVGNIYQKFEAMCQDVCQEVDGLMIQDKTKYVESQLQTGCDSVRKFCAEVMEDLLLPSAYSVKIPVSDLPLISDVDVEICKKTKKGFEECPAHEKNMMPTELEVLVSSGKSSCQAPLPAEEVNHHEECSALNKKSILFSTDVTRPNYLKNAEERIDVSVASTDTGDLSTVCPSESESIASIVSHENEVVENDLVPLGCLVSTGSGGSLKTQFLVRSSCHEQDDSQETMFVLKSSGNGYDQQGQSDVLMQSPDNGRFNDFDCEKASEHMDAIEPSNEAEEEFENVKLEEASVDAEAKIDDTPISHWNGKKRSYKKKFKDALSSRLLFAKKGEHGKVATWSGDVNTRTKQNEVISPSSRVIFDVDSKEMVKYESCESEWELL